MSGYPYVYVIIIRINLSLAERKHTATGAILRVVNIVYDEYLWTGRFIRYIDYNPERKFCHAESMWVRGYQADCVHFYVFVNFLPDLAKCDLIFEVTLYSLYVCVSLGSRPWQIVQTDGMIQWLGIGLPPKWFAFDSPCQANSAWTLV